MVADRRATVEPSTTLTVSPFSPQLILASSVRTERISTISLIRDVFAVTLSMESPRCESPFNRGSFIHSGSLLVFSEALATS